jgi:hypothetical protein
MNKIKVGLATLISIKIVSLLKSFDDVGTWLRIFLKMTAIVTLFTLFTIGVFSVLVFSI